jgi:isoquinoline 1-oxidoreductase beta subunit
MRKWTRRAFIGAGTVVGGGFVLGVVDLAFAPTRHGLVSDDAADHGELNTWITVTPDNIVTILVPHCEMGQGAVTGLAMMAAEEMEADWSLVRVKEAPALDAYANGYIMRAMTGPVPKAFTRGLDYTSYKAMQWAGLMVTGGSMSVRGTGVFGMTIAGAAAKEMLVGAAAERFGVSASECTASASRVTHTPSGRSATFGELARDATRQSVPSNPTLKPRGAYTLRRTPKPRVDIPEKVDGRAIYGIDFTTPGMLYAAIEMAPVYGGKLTSVDAAPAESMPGVKKVVRLESAVAVVADSYWRARRALAVLQPQFDDAGHGEVSSESIFAAFDASLGAPPSMPSGAAKTITADYKVPFLAHATMEPMVCTAKVEGDRAEIWAGVQDPLNARSTAAKALGFDYDNVHLTNLLLGGGFGRRLPYTFDYIDLGARVAKEMSPTPIKTIWSRENDIQHDYYRPAGMSRFAAALDATGRPLSVRSSYAGGGDGESTYLPYTIDDKKASSRDAKHPVRTGAWRSVLNSQHGFFKESFIDELAHAAGKDPFEFRRGMLGEEPRFKAVLEKAAELSGWGSPLPAGEGRGIAVTACFGSIVAEVAHVSVSPTGGLKVLNVYAAVDCGDVVNPDSAAAQVEGGIIFGLSAALVGEITFDKGRVVQRNFTDHQMIHMVDAPRIVSAFVPSDAREGGLGEPCVPPVAAAVCNAVYAATGVRVRELPIKKTKLTRA